MAVPTVTLRQLQYLAELASAGHFRRAAERIGVTQPSLSSQIALLEQNLGARLRAGSSGVIGDRRTRRSSTRAAASPICFTKPST